MTGPCGHPTASAYAGAEGGGRDDREELSERAREPARQQRNRPDADATWVKVIDAYDAAVRRRAPARTQRSATTRPRAVAAGDAARLTQAETCPKRCWRDPGPCDCARKLLDPRRPISLWELGNTYAIYAHCLALAGGLVLALGRKLLDVLGPAGADIAVKLQTATAAVAEARRSAKRRWWPGRR